MEGIEEPSQQKASEEVAKDNSIEVVAMNVETSVEADVCQASNGVAESEDVSLKDDQAPVDETSVDNAAAESVTNMEEEYVQYQNATELHPEETDNPEYIYKIEETEIPGEYLEPELTNSEIVDGNNIAIETEVIEESVEVDGIVENNSANISFETEILIENNTADLEEICEEPSRSNILSELGHNIELSEVLRSTDGSDQVENNNCEQEVFNKEELLDILEGNDTEQSRKVISENFLADSKKLEEHLAMQQLNRLKGGESKKRNRLSPKKPEKKQPKKNTSNYASKEKVEETVTSQHATKDPVDDTTNSLNASKETRSKAIAAKEVKAKANATSSSQNTSKDIYEKVDATNDTQIASNEKRKVPQTTISQNTSKGVKRKVIELNNSQNISKDETVEVTETMSMQNTPKEGKSKTVDKIHPNKTPTEAKSKAKVEAKPKKESIVKSLVQDWSDDEPNDHEANTILDESQNLLESTKELVVTQVIVVQEEGKPNETEGDEQPSKCADTSINDEITPNRRSGDETQPQRRSRESRVIKKKVIYDPDNPDTFTKTTKVQVKKEKDNPPEKDTTQVTPKKVKTDQTPQAVNTKSPLSKMQWKKPQPKSSRQSHRRLTEIDKLLMDEGAVNMICQLTPEALKGNKNMKSKAEFIKNIQSNTPDTKEMKFRERKSKVKTEELESKKHRSSKQRLSVSGSIKSPAASEDFENHSADDSIIYRRHSSSSYSSSCMSPRRLSDVDGGSSNQSAVVTQIVVQEVESIADKTNSKLFMAEKTSTPRRDSIMNKSDCLSIKEKLNSKLSLALNKRKLSSFQMEKPPKVKKVVSEEVSTDVTVNFNQKVAEICIRKAGSLFNVQIMRVLQNILLMVDSNKDIMVTLITSESGNLCAGLDLKPVVGDVRHHEIAYDIAEHARSLMLTMEKHSKLILIGVEGKIQGFSLALAALSDVLLASENTTFSLAERSNMVMHPGAGVLSSRALSQELLNELIVFGRELSASEALRGGLISRVIWPERFQEQVRAIAMDIASQPYENVKLKKQLLSLKKSGSASTFQAYLDKERDLLVKYWTSDEGMNLLRTSMDPA